MNSADRALIARLYESSHGDSAALFAAIVSVARDGGLDAPLAYLDRCVTARRLKWWNRTGRALPRTGSLLGDGYTIFYEHYLGLAIPRDGEIVERTDTRLVTRWWNACPTLAACRKLGLDTRRVCKQAYERPVEALVQQIDPRLHFGRNYAALRPYAPYCEEIISLSYSM